MRKCASRLRISNILKRSARSPCPYLRNAKVVLLRKASRRCLMPSPVRPFRCRLRLLLWTRPALALHAHFQTRRAAAP